MEEKIKNLIEKYEKYISIDAEEELDDYRKGDTGNKIVENKAMT